MGKISYIQRTSNFTVTSGYLDTISCQRSYRTEVDHDLWVSPDGNDANSGLDPSQPLRSITLAVHSIQADSLNIHTVHLLPGTFSSDDQIYPIPLKSFVNLIGASSGSSIILYDEYNALLGANVIGSQKLTNTMLSGFTIRSGLNPELITVFPLYIGKFFVDSDVTDVVIEGFHIYRSGIILKPVRTNFTQMTIRNCTAAEVAVTTYSDWVSGTLKDCVFENIESLNTGDPEYLRTVIDLWVEEQINIENCVFRDIRVQDEQMIFHVSNCRQDNQPVSFVINNTVFDNLRHNGKSPIIYGNNNVDSYTVSNCTFIDNFGTYGVIGNSGKLMFRNNIMYNPNAPKEMYIHNTFPEGYLSYTDMDYNLVHGGISGISNPWGNTLMYGQNNIDADPLFESTSIDDPQYLRLSASSPCINTGTPDTTGLDLPPYDLAGNWRVWNGRIDMGCYEFGSEPWVSNDDPVVPEIPAIKLVAYPNPFQTSSNIKISIPVEYSNKMTGISETSIDIYNIKGQKVRAFPFNPRSSLEQVIVWDGKDQNGNNCTSGLYIVNLTIAGEHIANIKITLVK